MNLKNIKDNFIMFGLVVPLVFSLIVVIIAYFAVPPFIEWLPNNKDKTQAVVEFDKNDYYLVSYENFAELRLNNFVGWLSSDDLGLGCAVTYDSEKEDANVASLSPLSKEPWINNGGLIVTGKNTDKVFRNLHKAKIGDQVTINFNGHEAYTYEVVEITNKENREESYRHFGNDTLVMCMQINDFRNLKEDYLYKVVVAKLVRWGDVNGWYK